MCPYTPDENEDPKPPSNKEEEEKFVEFILESATEQDLIDHLKAGFKKFGIEGTEEVFRTIYAQYPVLQEKYQKLYDKLIGRTK